jgi:hypothetical protein
VLVWQCLIPLVVLTTIFTLELWFAAVHNLVAPETTQLLWDFETSLVLAWWVRIDRQIRGLSVPFEFDAFVFFAWPLLVPYYLYRTRRARGLLLAAGIYGLLLTPFITAEIARIVHVR